MALDLLGVAVGNTGARKAADAIKAGDQKGIDKIGSMYDQASGNLQPYMGYGTGQGGVGGLERLASRDYSGFMNSPDYQAAEKAMVYGQDHSAASRGRLFSGGYAADLNANMGDLASQYLGNYRNSLQWGAGLGQNSASNLGQLGAAAGNNIAELYQDQGKARAGKFSAYANNGNNALNNITNSAFKFFGAG